MNSNHVITRSVRKIYSLIPFKKNVFCLLRKHFLLKDIYHQHLHFKGIFDTYIDDNSSFKMYHHGYILENTLFWEGILNGYESESMKLWISLCQNSRTIFDIGANTGVYSLVAKSVKPDADVYAFEPIKRIFDKLKKNVRINNYNIYCINKAVSDNDKSMIIHDTADEHIYNATLNKMSFHEQTHTIKTEIDAVKLSTFIKGNNITSIDLIKIDVERHEPEVLSGLQPYLNMLEPTILIEVIDNNIAEKLTNILQGTKYHFFYIDEQEGPVMVKKIFKRNYLNYLICTSDVAKQLNLSYES